MKRKSVVILGIKDRSKIRESMVTRKQGYGDEGETRKGELERIQRWVSMGGREDLGKIQGRSIDQWSLVFRSVGGEGKGQGQGRRDEDKEPGDKVMVGDLVGV